MSKRQPEFFDNRELESYPGGNRPDRPDGPDVTDQDAVRLGRQAAAVLELMRDGKARTLSGIAGRTGYPEASVSARLRDLRKVRFGGHVVTRTRGGDGGTWFYRVEVADAPA